MNSCVPGKMSPRTNVVAETNGPIKLEWRAAWATSTTRFTPSSSTWSLSCFKFATDSRG